MQFAKYPYQTRQEVQLLGRALQFQLVLSDLVEEGGERAAFCLFVREEPKLAVLGIRGSQTVEDWLANIKFNCAPVPESWDPEAPRTRAQTRRQGRARHRDQVQAAVSLGLSLNAVRAERQRGPVLPRGHAGHGQDAGPG